MRVTLLLMTLLSPSAFAQSDTTKLLEQGLRGAIATFTPVPEKDKSAILHSSAELLSRHVTFRPDGTAASICTFSGRKHVEWKRLVVNAITPKATTEADRLNGITSRYLVSLSCDAHRSWDNKTNTWGQWYSSGYGLFPSALTFDRKDNRWTAHLSSQLKHFQPGPGPSITARKPTNNNQPTSTPSRNPNDLPPGMTRGK